MARAIAVVAILFVFLAACASESGSGATADYLAGHWWLQSWDDGTTEWNVESEGELRMSARTPWIRFGERLEGNGGCNGFRGLPPGYRFEDGVLFPGEVLFTSALCGADGPPWHQMQSEMAIQAFLWGRSGQGFEVTFWNMGQQMDWHDDAVTMSWMKAGGEPPIGTHPVRQSFDRLRCAPDVVVREDMLASGVEPVDLLRRVAPGATTVEASKPFWWARDAAGDVIAEIAFGDVEPPVFSIYTCRDPK